MIHINIPKILIDHAQKLEEKMGEIYPSLKPLAKQCYLNTIETTVKECDNGDYFVITGDIPALWLRDSSAQLRPYAVHCKDSEELCDIFRGVIRRHAFYVNLDPYSNAFNEVKHDEAHKDDTDFSSPYIWERKYEVDSLCASVYLVADYYDATKDKSIFTKELHSIAKTNGGNRLITYATYKCLTDISLEFCDFISENIYVGWYGHFLDNWNDYLNQVDSYIESLGLSHLPIVMSEFGAAGIYGESNFESPKWSENYQSHYMKTSFSEFLKRDNIAGTFVWQFADIRVCREKVMDRARGFNNKGLLNEYRKPKMAYFTVKEIYSDIK